MPRPKPWIGNIPHILSQLRQSDQDAYTRREVQAIFEIGSSAALDLMNTAGSRLAHHPLRGTCLLVSRENLVHYLTYGPEAHAAQVEAARRAKLASTLTAAAKDQGLRSIVLRVERDSDWILRDLANVNIADGVCTVIFTDAVDLLTQLYKLAQAAGAEWDAFQRLCDAPERINNAAS